MDANDILTELKSLVSTENVAGMRRFGIRPARPLGVSVVQLRRLAKQAGKSHEVAAQLWATGIHEARIKRNFVKKAVSWAFRTIGKRNDVMRREVRELCGPLTDSTDRTTRWIAKRALQQRPPR